MSKGFSWFLCLSLALLFGAAFAQDAERSSTVIFDIDEGAVVDPTLWNPYAPGRRIDQGLSQAMAEPLFIMNLENPEGEIIPWLAEGFTSNETADVWTITLREGTEWSDGEALDADDFLFTVNLGMNNSELNGMPSFANVASVEKIDERTLQFTLNEPEFRFLQNTFVVQTGTSFIVLPEHIWAAQDDLLTFTNYDPEQGWPVFSGAYTLSSASENEFTYTRNDDWWGAKTGWEDLPAPEQLVWVAFGTPEARTTAMARDELDSLMDVDFGPYLALQAQNPNVISWSPAAPFAWFDPCPRNFNFNTSQAPWDDADMRKAINYAINRDQIIDIAYEGTSPVSKHWFPAYSAFDVFVNTADEAGLYDLYPLLQHDPEQAKTIIESKGYTLNGDYYEKDGEQLATTITSFDDTEMNNVASLIVEQLQGIGVNATHDIQPIPEFIENLTGGKFDTYVFFVCGPVDAWAKMDAFSTRHLPEDSSAPVSGFYSNTQRWNTENAETYSAAVAQMQQLAPDDEAQKTLFVDAMTAFMQDMPAVPISQAIKLVPFGTTYWTNWPTAENPYIQPATWWQSTHVIIHNLQPAQ